MMMQIETDKTTAKSDKIAHKMQKTDNLEVLEDGKDLDLDGKDLDLDEVQEEVPTQTLCREEDLEELQMRT